MRRAKRPAPRRGFGLLEAIVALALLAGTGVALFDWLNLNLQTAARLAQTEAQARLMLSAQAAVSAVNPSARPQGTLSTGGVTVSWRAAIVQPERANTTELPETPGPWRVGLYRMDVSAESTDGHKVRFSQLQTGTRRARPLEKPS